MGVTICAVLYPYVFYKTGTSLIFPYSLEFEEPQPENWPDFPVTREKEIFSLSLRTQVFRKFWIAKIVVLS